MAGHPDHRRIDAGDYYRYQDLVLDQREPAPHDIPTILASPDMAGLLHKFDRGSVRSSDTVSNARH